MDGKKRVRLIGVVAVVIAEREGVSGLKSAAVAITSHGLQLDFLFFETNPRIAITVVLGLVLPRIIVNLAVLGSRATGQQAETRLLEIVVVDRDHPGMNALLEKQSVDGIVVKHGVADGSVARCGLFRTGSETRRRIGQ